jgi:glycosyltransferase involved in cell wall biosynthesis
MNTLHTPKNIALSKTKFMKKKSFFPFLLLFVNIFLYAMPIRQFVIVIPSFNNNKINTYKQAGVYKKNLDSVFSQTYPFYRVIYIDDASEDGTGVAVKKYIQEKGQEHRVTLITNEKNKGQLENRYVAAHMCDNKEIIVLLDGDDWFADNHVLKKLAQVYADPDVWMTYGQYVEHCPHCSLLPAPYYHKKSTRCKHTNTGGACPLPDPTNFEQTQLRKYLVSPECRRKGTGWVFGHLYTFYASLFKNLTLKDLTRSDGTFYTRGTDIAIMVQLAELAGYNHIRFIPDILYIYNLDTHYDKNRPFIHYSIKNNPPKMPISAIETYLS